MRAESFSILQGVSPNDCREGFYIGTNGIPLYTTAREVVEARVSDKLQAAYDQLDSMISETKTKLLELETEQHFRCCKIASLMVDMSRMLEQMRAGKEAMMIRHNDDLERLRVEHTVECEKDEGKLEGCHKQISDSPHVHPELEDAIGQAYTQLENMAASIEGFAKDMLQLHNDYPNEIETFYDGYKDRLGGLVGLGPLSKPPQQGESPTAEDVSADHSPGDPAEQEASENTTGSRQLWPGVVPAGMFEVFTLRQFVEERVCKEHVEEEPCRDEAENVDEASTEYPGNEQEGEDAAAEGSEIAEPEDKAPTWPRRVNGEDCILDVHVEAEWLCEYIHTIRLKLMESVQTEAEVLLQASNNAARKGAEELSCELDERLRRHATRKGFVRSEWYEPRLKQIISHKRKFERHIIGIARKSAAQDEQFNALIDVVIEADQRFHASISEHSQTLSELKAASSETKASNADATLEGLKALERQSKDAGDESKTVYLTSTTRQVDNLVSANNDVIRLQKEQTLEGYSIPEIEGRYTELGSLPVERSSRPSGRRRIWFWFVRFYAEETRKLNESLLAKAAIRRMRIDEIQAAMDKMVGGALGVFEAERTEVLEEMKNRYGLGQEHTAARRLLEGKIRDISSPITEALSKILSLGNYLTKLIGSSSVSEISSVPGCPRDHLLVTRTPYLDIEIRGSLSIFIASVIAMLERLEGLKPQQREKFTLKKAPQCRVLQRLPWQFDPTSDPDEASIRSDSLKAVVGVLSVGEQKTFPGEVEASIASLTQRFAADLPYYLKEYVNHVRSNTGSLRAEALAQLKATCLQLRNDVIPQASLAVFTAIESDAVAQLESALTAAMDRCSGLCERSDKKHSEHLKTLERIGRLETPDLESELALVKLKRRETVRHLSASTALYAARAEAFKILVDGGLAACETFDAAFECILKHLDSVPWGELFDSIPGVEDTVPRRMSLKRLMRMRDAGETEPIDQSGESLPSRLWEGVNGSMIIPDAEAWSRPRPVQKDDAQNSEEQETDDFRVPEVKAAEERSVHSYRSEAHKTVLRTRNDKYSATCSMFSDLGRNALDHLDKLEEAEDRRSAEWEKSLEHWGLEDLEPVVEVDEQETADAT
ncbi:hypothetical protein FOL47_008290 [Perkinsus chesapeaki]|uniref:Uncharacterized protein n=1 Tax=Perkinsus chesapeaki TaxID=330153 RepID=A0A7J6LFZ2_PERCH|nr:hypothetical protein FOL47_008290 [Perkinsus chesapeaki]